MIGLYTSMDWHPQDLDDSLGRKFMVDTISQTVLIFFLPFEFLIFRGVE